MNSREGRFAGRTAVVTGAASGIGAAVGRRLAAEGASVVLTDVRPFEAFDGAPARQLAVEYGPALRVNTVLPGPILTPAWDWVPAEDRSRSVAETVAGRFGTPDEVAAAVAFLASPEAAYLTGASLVVDGGWTAVKSST